MVSTGLIIGGLAVLYVLSKPREYTVPFPSLGEGYMDAYNITINPTLKEIITKIVELNVEYPFTLDPGFVPVVKVPVNFYDTDAGSFIFCRIKDANTGALVTKQKSNLILFGGNGSHVFTFSGRVPTGDWAAVMPNTAWNLTIECGISWV